MNKIRAELKEYFPYRVIDIESAEADDIIATLVKEKHEEQNILILSGDKDFIQLHKYDGVQQYDPVRKRKIAHDNPKRYLVEHILKGDSGDGIPNVLSPDNCFVVGERQKPMTAKKIAQYLTSDPSTIEDPIVLRNYYRNQQLIDLSFVPSYIEDKVLEQYDSQKGKDRSKLMNYFINNKLKNLMEHMSEF
jgi:5'-3' exonuclease